MKSKKNDLIKMVALGTIICACDIITCCLNGKALGEDIAELIKVSNDETKN